MQNAITLVTCLKRIHATFSAHFCNCCKFPQETGNYGSDLGQEREPWWLLVIRTPSEILSYDLWTFACVICFILMLVLPPVDVYFILVVRSLRRR